MPLWWALYIVGNVLSRLAQRMIESAETVELVLTLIWIDIASSAMSFVSAALLLIIVDGIIRAQARWKSIEPAPATPSPTALAL
jgi:hypothetical protein